MKKIGLILLSLVAMMTLVACDNNTVEVEDETTKKTETKLEENNKYADVKQNPIVTMEMESGDIVKIELYPQIAATTVENFIDLIEKGFYDGLTFHRVIPTFMAQGGCPSGDGTGGPGYTIKGEFKANNFKNELKHDIGVISMARTSDVNGGGSQFFIVTDKNSYQSLDGSYAGFGKVIEGMDTVYAIVNQPVVRKLIDDDVIMAAYNASVAYQTNGTLTKEDEAALDKYYEQQGEIDRPINPPVIKKMTVETFGVEYDEPEKIMK